jgi:hypothetical protein
MCGNHPSILYTYNPWPAHFRAEKMGSIMTVISIGSAHAVSDAQTGDHSLKTIALLSCFGLVASLCLMTLGVDLGAAWL